MSSLRSPLSASCALLAAAAVLALAACVHAHEEHTEVADHQVTLRDVCLNRQVPIVSVAEVRRLIKELEARPSDCQENYRQAFYELEPLLVTDSNTPLCSQEEFDQIKEYHFRYINPLVETYKLGDDLNKLNKKIVDRPLHEGKFDYTVQLDDFKQEILIPISLAQFFKSWALQASGMCKRTLVDNLDKAMQLMSDMDYELLEGKALEASPDTLNQVSKLMTTEEVPSSADGETGSSVKSGGGGGGGGIGKLLGLGGGGKKKPAHKKSGESEQQQQQFKYGLSFHKLVYMPELEGELEEGDLARMQQTKVLDLRSKPELNKFMHACARRFKPVYSKLILPIVRLSKLGYDYVGPALDDIRAKLYSDPLVAKWLLVTMVCESQGRVELVESPEGSTEVGELKLEPQLEYDPIYNYKIEGELWIKGAEALTRELNRMRGEQSKGFKKFLYEAGIMSRRAVAFIDPHQFAWYRRNQNTLSSFLNTMSIISNLASIGVSVSG